MMIFQDQHCPLSRWELLKRQLNNLSLEDLSAWLDAHPEVVLLDVSTPKEFSAGHIEGAYNLDYFGDDFIERLLELDREKTYLVYCRSGRRSVRVATLLRNAGLEKVYNLYDGLGKGVTSVTNRTVKGR